MASDPRSNYEDDVDDDSSDDSNHTLFRDRPEWSDIQPVEQDDGPYPVVKISYSPKFQDAYDYLRAVIKKGEKTQRVLALTSVCINFNAANYTAWQYRRDVLEELKIPDKVSNQALPREFEEELAFSRDMIEDNNKNYQVWHHRKILVSWASGYDKETNTHTLDDPKDCDFVLTRELRLTSTLLNKDAKNYHAWQHRQWVLRLFGNFENELTYATSLIEIDVRNNSAWNQRFFVVQNLKHKDDKLIQKEIKYTTEQILKAVSNESPWSYLRGLWEMEGKLGEQTEFLEQCKQLIQSECPSVPLHVFVLEVYEDRLEKGDQNEEMLQHGKTICDLLANKLDTLRKGYWGVRKHVFEANGAA